MQLFAKFFCTFLQNLPFFLFYIFIIYLLILKKTYHLIENSSTQSFISSILISGEK